MNGESLTPDEERRIREAFEAIPFAHFLGIELGDLRRGTATIYLQLRDELKRNNGVTHGGVVASLVDTAAAFAILSLLNPQETTSTIDLTVHYLRPLLQGRVSTEAQVVRAGRRVLVVSINVFNEDSTLAATALTSFIKLS